MRSVFPIWSDAGIAVPKRRGLVSRLAVAAVAVYACVLGAIDVYPQLFADAALEREASAPMIEPPAVLVPPAPSRLLQTTDGSAIRAAVFPRSDPRRAPLSSAAIETAPVQRSAVAETAATETPQQPTAASSASASKPQSRHRSKRTAATVQVYTMPDGREVYGHRPADTGFEPWDRMFDGSVFGMRPSRGALFNRSYDDRR